MNIRSLRIGFIEKFMTASLMSDGGVLNFNVLAYNIKRMINLVGVRWLMNAIPVWTGAFKSNLARPSPQTAICRFLCHQAVPSVQKYAMEKNIA